MNEFGLTQEEFEMVNRVANALVVRPEKVIRTPYVKLIEMLVETVESQTRIIDKIEKFVEDNI
jgi:hypothetical protein